MSKRFIDTGFLDQKWIRKLSPEKKIFLIYLMLKCDNGGVIDLDIEDVEFWIGKKIGNINFLPENYLIPLNDSGKYFMPKFIEWQYPNFPLSKVHQQEQAKQLLTKHGIFDPVNQVFILPKTYLTLTQELPNIQANGNGNANGSDIGNANEKKPRKTKNEFIPPSLEEVISYFKENHYLSQSAIRAFKHYDLANWHDTNGKPVLNWKQKISTNWFKSENLDRTEPEIIPPKIPRADVERAIREGKIKVGQIAESQIQD